MSSSNGTELQGQVYAHLLSYGETPHRVRVEHSDGSGLVHVFLGPLQFTLSDADTETFCNVLNTAVLGMLVKS